MAIDSNLIKLAVDGYKGHVAGDYSVGDTQEALRNALVEANGGSTKLDLKAIRDGKCNGVFAIVEELVNVIHEEGLKGDEFFMNMVEDRNMSLMLIQDYGYQSLTDWHIHRSINQNM